MQATPHWTVYLSGEIHTDWRDQIATGAQTAALPVSFSSAVTNHEDKSSKVNGIRTKSLIERCDVAVIRFGDKYKQWNAAFDAGYCAALGKPYITLHDDTIIHPLKEVDAAAMAWATTPDQVVEILKYVTQLNDTA